MEPGRWLTAALAAALNAAALSGASRDARADDGALVWTYPRFRTGELATTAVAGVAAVGARALFGPPRSPRWVGGILFDDPVRDGLRLRSPDGRETARIASNLTALSALFTAIGVDSLAVPLARGSPETAAQLLLIDAEAFAVSGFLTTLTSELVGRARPSYIECQRDPYFDPLCAAGATASFYSGHTAASFTAAGLSCAHHVYAHVYGAPLADALGCAGILSLATSTGALRVLGDRHYTTDVLVGAIVGFGVGFAVPTLLHYTGSDPPATAAPGTAVAGGLGPGASTFQLSGRF